MASSAYRRWALLAGWATVAWAAACEDRPLQEMTSPRLLDQLCKPSSADCKLSGSARLTTGITDDSLGVKLGPEPGALHLRWPTLTGVGGTSSSGSPGSQRFEVLVRGKGRLMKPAGSPSLTDDFSWQTFAVTATFDSEPGFLLVAEAVQGSEIEIVDVRETRALEYGCSVAAVGRR